MKYEYPECRKSDLVEDYFGTKLEAPYTWLRNTDDPEVKDFTKRENDFTDNWFREEAGFGTDNDEVKAMIEKLKKEKTSELPMAISPWGEGYLSTEDHDGEYSIISLDSNFEKKDTLFRRYDLPERTPFGAEACPLDNNVLAIMSQIDNAPRPDYVLYDFDKKEILGILPMTFGGSWSKTKKVLYAASTKTEGGKSFTAIVAYYIDEKEIKEVFTFSGNAIFGNVWVSEDGRSVLFSFSADYSNDYFFKYNEETGEVFPINENQAMQVKYIDSFAINLDETRRHYFLSYENTPHGEVIAIDDEDAYSGTSDTNLFTSKAEAIYKEEVGYLEEGFQMNEKIYLQCAENGASHIIDMNTGKKIPMPQSVASLTVAGKTKNEKLFSFDSFLTQPQILKFDGAELKSVMGNDVEHEDMIVELLHAPSKEDGKEIPYYLVRKKDAEKNGNNKALMYGYGGYNISMPPWSTERISQTNIAAWVSEGGIYVHCLLRGGNEYGSQWHDEGMGMKKKNCYYDFIGIAEKVISDGWTKPERIAISGCSNGGLLMSALVTMRPDLWGCVIDSVPHTDMIHFAEDDRGPMYITEYGDPRMDKETFEYLLSYSPVHNVKETNYPATYIQTGECDNNVPPYHGKSFAATMQEKNQSDKPILLRVLEKGSHDRGQGEVFWQTIAEMHVFMEKALKF